MPSLLGRNGYIRSQLQTLYLWLSGNESFFVHRASKVRFPDMSFLLASYQGKPEQTLPCLSSCLLRRSRRVQTYSYTGVSYNHSVFFPCLLSNGIYRDITSHRRLTQQKKQRERERKELDILGRRHLANVRVVQRNVVYITGIGSRFAKEEVYLPDSLTGYTVDETPHALRSLSQPYVPMSTSANTARLLKFYW